MGPKKACQKNPLARAGLAPHSAAVARCQCQSSASGQLTALESHKRSMQQLVGLCVTSSAEQPLGSSNCHIPEQRRQHPSRRTAVIQELLSQKRYCGAYSSEPPWLRREASRCWSPHPAAYTGPRCGNQDKNKKRFH